MWEVVQNSASPQTPFFLASDNKTEHFLLYLEEDVLFFFCFFGGGGGGGVCAGCVLKPRIYQL